MARVINLVYPYWKQYLYTMQKISSKTSKDGKVIAKHGGAEHNTFPIRTGVAGEFGGIEQLVTNRSRKSSVRQKCEHCSFLKKVIICQCGYSDMPKIAISKPSMFASVGWRYSLTLAASFALFGFIVFLVRTIIG